MNACRGAAAPARRARSASGRLLPALAVALAIPARTGGLAADACADAASTPAAIAPDAAAPPGDDGQAPASRMRASAALKDRGDALFRSRDFVGAVASYDEAYGLYANPRLLYNKGRALEALGRYGEALETLTRFQREAPASLQQEVPGLPSLLEDLHRRIAEVTLRVNVDGAQIIVGSEVVGVTPLPGPLWLNAGRTRLQIVKEGYFSSERDVVLPGGGTAVFEATLESKVRRAKLTVESRVPGSDIRVDGRAIGQAPTEVVLVPGLHRVEARRAGYRDGSTQVLLETGQDRTIRLDPVEERRALYREWWFWGAVGIVAGSATAAIVLANGRHTPTEGNFSPNTISAPLGRF